MGGKSEGGYLAHLGHEGPVLADEAEAQALQQAEQGGGRGGVEWQ